MINLRLAGGLGNQLFQIGAMLLLQKSTDHRLCIYTSKLSKYKAPRALELTKILNLTNVHIEPGQRLPLILRLRLARLLRIRLLNVQMISDDNFQSVYLSKFKGSRIYADGYFIESISQEIFDEMLNELTDRLKSTIRENATSEVCVIHIRGGDFLELGWDLPNIKKFYSDAIKDVLKRDPSIKFEIISDDPMYAHRLISELEINFDFVGKEIVSDFRCLINAKFAILSNSTFAFWAGAFRSSRGEEPTTWMPRFWKPGHSRVLKLRTEQW